MPTMPLSKLLLINDLIKNPTFVEKKKQFFFYFYVVKTSTTKKREKIRKNKNKKW